MNTRQSIQPSTTPAVLGISYSVTRSRFAAALSDGLKIFRADNCLTTYESPTASKAFPIDCGLAIVEVLDDRHLACVAGGKAAPARAANVLIFWDCLFECEVSRFDFAEPIQGVRIGTKALVVVLEERAVVFEYQELEATKSTKERQLLSPPLDDDATTASAAAFSAKALTPTDRLRGPNRVLALHPTNSNPYAIACLRNDLLVLPAQSIGQVQLIPLPAGAKRVIRAHNSALRSLALSLDATLLATASEQGTLIRVFDTRTLDHVAEFRRGVDHAVVFSLAFSDGNRWLVVTSDKGTIHVFDLRPAPLPEPASFRQPSNPSHRKHPSHPPPSQPHRLSTGPESLSAFSTRSSPASATQTTTHPASGGGSIQEYYGLRPPPSSASPHPPNAAASALQSFRSSSFAPRFLRDVRSVASAQFDLGSDPPHWQGGAAYSWTVAPDGTRKRVKNAVSPLPGRRDGRPVKGVVAFARTKPGVQEGDEEGASLYVIGGGSDAQWEMFDLSPAEGGGWALVRRGFRRYLTRQFVD